MSLYMQPVFTTTCAPYRGVVDVVAFRKSACRESGSANFSNSIFGQARSSASFSLWATTSVSTLSDHVKHVVALGAKKEMLRVGAQRVIALVQNIQPIGDRAIVEFPRHAMRIRGFTIANQPAIAARGASLPLPTPIRFGAINSLPELLNEHFRGILAGHLRLHSVGVMPLVVSPTQGLHHAFNYTKGHCAERGEA
jgi:hypothetical protein